MTHDFSDIAEMNLQWGLRLCQEQGYIAYHSAAKKLELFLNWSEICVSAQDPHYSILRFGQSFSLGAECIAKAVCISKQIDIFSKKDLSHFDPCYWADNITAASNPWLQGILFTKRITHVKELNTGTLGKIIKPHLPALQAKGVISSSEKDTLCYALAHLLTFRRNADAHFYFKSAVLVSSGDLPDLYIPAINLLIEVYYQP